MFNFNFICAPWSAYSKIIIIIKKKDFIEFNLNKYVGTCSTQIKRVALTQLVFLQLA